MSETKSAVPHKSLPHLLPSPPGAISGHLLPRPGREASCHEKHFHGRLLRLFTATLLRKLNSAN